MRERYCANLISLALCACQAADHPVERHDLLNRQASVDGRKNALRIIGIEPMIGLHGDDVRTQLARLARKRAGLDAERLGGVAGRDRNGGIGSFPAVPARQRRGRSTLISGPPNSSALTWRSVTRRPDDNVLDLLS